MIPSTVAPHKWRNWASLSRRAFRAETRSLTSRPRERAESSLPSASRSWECRHSISTILPSLVWLRVVAGGLAEPGSGVSTGRSGWAHGQSAALRPTISPAVHPNSRSASGFHRVMVWSGANSTTASGEFVR